MKPRLSLPRTLVFVLTTGTLTAAATSSCNDDEECIACIPDYRADGGVPSDAVQCPPCLPKDGVCPVGCIPEGFV